MAKKPTLKKRKNALGRGLGALLSDAEVNTPVEKESTSSTVDSVSEVPLEFIETNPFQPRSEESFELEQEALDELADSIKEHGIIQPITVRKLSGQEYQLISGERRLRASKIAGLETIPAYIRTANDQQMLEMALIENIQRQDLNPIEIALSYNRLMTECELRQEDLGERVGKKRSTVTNYLRLLKLPASIQQGLRSKKLSMGHARALVNIDDISQQLLIYKKIIEEGLSVRKVEELVRNLLSNSLKGSEKTLQKSVSETQRAIQEVEHKLQSQFSTRVKVNSNDQGKGEIKIPFENKDDLNRILDLLNY
ncbi:MAG: ParB/RepB/Spo0J family partition protein [Flammeovirgaceae bacterium]